MFQGERNEKNEKKKYDNKFTFSALCYSKNFEISVFFY